MPVSKQLARLGPLGLFAMFGLSACCTWSGYRIPYGPYGASTETVVTSSPTVNDAAANPPAAAPAPPAETSAASTLSVPGPVGGAPPAQSGTDSGVSGPADNAVPPAAPDTPPRSAESAPAAGSNQDELRTQKPIDASASAADAPVSGQQAVTGNAPLPAPVGSAGIQVTAGPPATHPPAGPLAKLRARFHNLIQPSSKSTTTASKNAKTPGPVAASHNPPPQAVASVQIPLPMSDQNRVAQEDSQAAHGLSPVAEGQTPVAPASARDSQAGPQSANAAADFQTKRMAPDETREKPAPKDQIEQWPFGPQAAAAVTNASSSPPATNEFDPIPVDEYKAAVAKANGDGTSLPVFQQASPTQTDGVPASSPQPVAGMPAVDELRVVPTTEAPAVANRPALMPLDSDDRSEPTQTTLTPPQTNPASAPGSTGSVAPAGQISPAGGTQSATTPTPTHVVRSPQWIGGRYGQPAWMVPYVAPATSAGQ